MRINFCPIKPKFKGYDAVPIKNLYMQNAPYAGSLNFFNELKKIGKKENFDVFIQADGKILDQAKDVPIDEKKNNIWAQDNKILRPSKEGSLVLTYNVFNPCLEEAQEFAKIKNKKIVESETVFEGGNIFIGKKDDGEEYMLTGHENIRFSSIYEFFKENGVEDIEQETFEEFLEYGNIPTKANGEGEIVYFTDWEKNSKYYNNKVLEKFSKDFNIKKENIYIIHQPNFHIDMTIRPIGYPYVLVNDSALSIKNLTKLNPRDKSLTSNTQEYEEIRLTNYCSTSKTIEELEKYGFKPIRIAGVYSLGEVNFLNAIINKHKDGTISYITNSSNCQDADFSKLEKIFEKELKSKVPNVKNVYFVRGQKITEEGMSDLNEMMETLLKGQGGIHCMTLEEPDFEKY